MRHKGAKRAISPWRSDAGSHRNPTSAHRERLAGARWPPNPLPRRWGPQINDPIQSTHTWQLQAQVLVVARATASIHNAFRHRKGARVGERCTRCIITRRIRRRTITQTLEMRRVVLDSAPSMGTRRSRLVEDITTNTVDVASVRNGEGRPTFHTRVGEARVMTFDSGLAPARNE